MRIISQNKQNDLPYDNNRIHLSFNYYSIDNEYEYYVAWNDLDIGKYSSKEKALKVMEMIRDRYMIFNGEAQRNMYFQPNNYYFQMPQDNGVE